MQIILCWYKFWILNVILCYFLLFMNIHNTRYLDKLWKIRYMSNLIELNDNNFSPILSYNTLKNLFFTSIWPLILFLMVEMGSPSSKIVIFICHTYIFGQKTKKLFKNRTNGRLWRPSWIFSDGYKMKTNDPISKIKTLMTMFFYPDSF